MTKRLLFSFITIKWIKIKHFFAKIFGRCADTWTIISECMPFRSGFLRVTIPAFPTLQKNRHLMRQDGKTHTSGTPGRICLLHRYTWVLGQDQDQRHFFGQFNGGGVKLTLTAVYHGTTGNTKRFMLPGDCTRACARAQEGHYVHAKSFQHGIPLETRLLW